MQKYFRSFFGANENFQKSFVPLKPTLENLIHAKSDFPGLQWPCSRGP